MILAVVSSELIRAQPAASETIAHAGTRLAGVDAGPHAVGFEVRRSIDPTRRINQSDPGTSVGLALWYPAQPTPGRRAISGLDYRLLDALEEPTESERDRYADEEANALVGWRHIGIVPLTNAQAHASLSTTGIAVRRAPPAAGRRPLVVILGGQHYLSTTAEVLASHGWVVVAPFRFADQANEVATAQWQWTWYLENSVRDAEWAVAELRAHPHVDLTRVSVIGHGGGGLQALLFAMRNTHVDALVNIDAGNFSTRSRARDIAFYDPRLARVPYLYVATAETRKGQDLFDDFLQMRFSDRFEVIVNDAALRHHDLSDLGRAITAPMGIRGDAQAGVQSHYVRLHDTIVRFLQAHAGTRGHDADFTAWLDRQRSADYTVEIRPGSVPAPTIGQVLARVDASVARHLRDARLRDLDAPVFQSNNLSRIVQKALAARNFDVAIAVAEFALEIHASSPIFHELKSEALEARGDVVQAAEIARACAAMEAGTDWRAASVIAQCKDRAERLATRPRL